MTGSPLERLGVALLAFCSVVSLWGIAFTEAPRRTQGQLIADVLWFMAIVVLGAITTWSLMLAVGIHLIVGISLLAAALNILFENFAEDFRV
jgi:hypothetical protein